MQLEAEKSKLIEASKSNAEKDESLKQMKNDLENTKEDLRELKVVRSGRFLGFPIRRTGFFDVTI